MAYHKPVLLQESIEALKIQPSGVYVDVTFGGGGHTKEILKSLTTGRLLAFDQDLDAITNKPNDKKVTLINQNFKYLKNYLRLHKAIPVNGILADLGVSSFHFDQSGKGFSFRFDEPLDMRMNKDGEQKAFDVVNGYDEKSLKDILRKYGELKNAGRIAREIVKKRAVKTLKTVFDLKEAIETLVPKTKANTFLAKVFQAIRIEVNQELEVLQKMLEQTVEVLAPGGRLVVISYHSLEDRLVKSFIKTGNFSGEVQRDVVYGNAISPFKQINKKIIEPTEKEIKENPRARSAKMRVAEKL